MSETIVGNLTRDPELRYTPSGKALAKFGVAVTERVKTADGWRDGETAFHNVAAFGSLAENVAEQIRKGQRVVVVGDRNERTWTDKDGEERTSEEIVASDVGPSLKWGDRGR